MNAQDYISSGMLEAYVLGSLSEAEFEQVAGAICRFPEVATEVAALEETLFLQAELGAVAPPPALEDQIWAVLEQQPAPAAANASAPPVRTIPLPPPAATPTSTPAPQLQPAGPKRFQFGLAASLILLVCSVAATFAVYQNGKSREARLLTANERLRDDLGRRDAAYRAIADRYRRESEMAANPDMQAVAMRSLKPGESMAATMYWNAAKQQAYVSVHKLPEAPAGMQYQLWAIADGKPVSLGMIENAVAAEGGMQPVALPVAAGQAFAVSLEQAGGVPSPTAERIMLMGKVPA